MQQDNPAPETDSPIGYVTGKPIEQVPDGLYIHPDALQVFLDEFSGPLDLLLYLIKRNNIDLELINIAEIANQYLEYIKLMKKFKIQLAAEYLVMAAILAELKSRTLLPKTEDEQEQEEQDGAILIIKLKEYEKIRQKSEELSQMPRLDRDFFIPFVRYDAMITKSKLMPTKDDLANSLKKVLSQKKLRRVYGVKLSELSTRDRMISILDKLNLAKSLKAAANAKEMIPFEQLFSKKEGRDGVAVSLLALTQLIKERLVEVTQSSAYSRIYVHSPSMSSPSSQSENEDAAEDLDTANLKDKEGKSGKIKKSQKNG